MNYHRIFTATYQIYFCLAIFLFTNNIGNTQTIQQEKMTQLHFMVGEWIGTSSSIKKDTISKQVAVFEEVAFKLDSHLITIDLHSESLQLHTTIYYDEKDQKYYYTPYSKRGAKKYPAEYKEGKFIVWFNENKRLIFSLTTAGHFQEYGESFKEGVWRKYFEDILVKAP